MFFASCGTCRNEWCGRAARSEIDAVPLGAEPAALAGAALRPRAPGTSRWS
jgi:hypothetical protein